MQGAQKGEQIWDDMAKELLSALAYFLFYEASPRNRTFPPSSFCFVIWPWWRGNDSSPLEQMFTELEQREPEHIAFKHYRAYHSGATKTLQSIFWQIVAMITVPIIIKAADQGMTPVIPPRKNRKHLREYDEYLYKLRHLVENAFLLLKRWRGIATRYAKNASSFAAVQIRCIAIWLLVYCRHHLDTRTKKRRVPPGSPPFLLFYDLQYSRLRQSCHTARLDLRGRIGANSPDPYRNAGRVIHKATIHRENQPPVC